MVLGKKKYLHSLFFDYLAMSVTKIKTKKNDGT